MGYEKPARQPKAAGIISEYNPFHNGHAYQIAEIRRRSGADYVIAVMSGDFMQRGAPALLDKYVRTRMALLGGIDLVLELPCAAATGSAALFAQESVRILDCLGVVQELWFGSEAGDTELFSALSGLLSAEPPAYRSALRRFLREGNSYPLARRKALEDCLADALFPEKSEELRHFLEAPNNILGLEYCIALKKLKSRIRPCTLKRRGSGYHDLTLSKQFSSASALREIIRSEGAARLENQFPENVHRALTAALTSEGWLEEDDFSLLLKYLLLGAEPETLDSYFRGGLARRILAKRTDFLSFSQFTDLLKTKDRTRSGIQRGLLRLLLEIPARSEVSAGNTFSGELPCRTITDAGFARVLGFRRQAASLLTLIKHSGCLALEARPAALPQKEYQTDLRASNLYEAVRSHKMAQPFREERSRQPVIL